MESDDDYETASSSPPPSEDYGNSQLYFPRFVSSSSSSSSRENSTSGEESTASDDMLLSAANFLLDRRARNVLNGDGGDFIGVNVGAQRNRSVILNGDALLEIDSSDSMDYGDQPYRAVSAPRRRLNPRADDYKYDVIPKVPRPTHRYNALLEFDRHRTFGKTRAYRRKCYGSLRNVQRLELMSKLEGHYGCVNTVSFNAEGNLLCSGSDDQHVMLWEWETNRQLLMFETRHRSNIFQTKFMPHKNNRVIVTASRDGSIRYNELDEKDFSLRSSRKIAYHRGAVHKIAMHPELHETILSAGEDGTVYDIDLRSPNPSTLVNVKGRDENVVGHYSIAINPLHFTEFLTSGMDRCVRVFDRRNARADMCIREICPSHLEDVPNSMLSVSCAVYNYDGSEILASYSDEDIYLFANDLRRSDQNFLKRYRGHRNSQTVKGVNFFGQHSEFIVSGSDCGHIFLWDKETSHIVNMLYGDEGGVVNVLEPNPCAPYLATSGFDHNVKIWVPSADEDANLDDLRLHTIENMRQRERDVSSEYREFARAADRLVNVFMGDFENYFSSMFDRSMMPSRR